MTDIDSNSYGREQFHPRPWQPWMRKKSFASMETIDEEEIQP